MKDQDCVEFLQWALPQLDMRWQGFRRVRKQVCKRVQRRMRALAHEHIESYCAYLQANPEEWTVLDSLTRVTISRFYRDQHVFERLRQSVFPDLATAAANNQRAFIAVCSLGCGAGEEPYSVSLVWRLAVQASFPSVALRLVAVDADPQLVERARDACYQPGSLKEVPAAVRTAGFIETANGLCLRDEYKQPVSFHVSDIRDGLPDGTYDIVLCRNSAFTYFVESLQIRIARSIHTALRPGGFLITGAHERLPESHPFDSVAAHRCYYRKSAT